MPRRECGCVRATRAVIATRGNWRALLERVAALGVRNGALLGGFRRGGLDVNSVVDIGFGFGHGGCLNGGLAESGDPWVRGPRAGLKDICGLIKQQSVLILRLESKGAADGLDRGFEGGSGGERLPEEGGDIALVA
jgi:hypothetical protein